MIKPLSLAVALRYLRANRRSGFLSFFSVVSIISLMLGVATLITVLSVFNGFERELKTRILGMVPHGVLLSEPNIQNWPSVVEEVATKPGVEAAAPFTQLQGMIAHDGRVNGVMVTGIEPEYENQVSIIGQFMRYGDLRQALEPGDFDIVIGMGLARSMGVLIGDKITLVLPEASVSPAGVVPRFKRFTISAIFETKSELDSNFVFIHWQDAAKLKRMQGVQGVRIKVDELFAARGVVQGLVDDYRGQFYGRDWTFTHGTLFNAVQMERTMIQLLLFLIVIVASFNIISSLIMLVKDKRSDIAIFRTMGASRGFILRVFVLQGALIGIIGTVLGVILGVLLATYISDIVAWYESLTRSHLFNAYFVNFLPSELRWHDVIVVAGIALVISLIATIYPSYIASKIQPAEALRYE
ncbi:MAG: lipoprotein-releasing ABC transporter permease subunit [Pseudomonadota bacterium]|nr:lipoprotein-releasing ABC transporter permease subunit [Pseudomonadota bacterium]